ncbi:hypothetical protein [Flavobacterium sp.]|uniref:coiled-coil domain-containing protein n=1 Tax=Flavobacterium sp. TaxID=239 RepID=UPI00286E459E|nr:hypothetical protein [Flavobacterium sp.]
MRTNLKEILFFQIVMTIMSVGALFAQANSFSNTSMDSSSVVMTWNKNTPEQEMLDDIKALKQNNGVTIKYSNLKRNINGEITAIKIEYKDQDGNTGSQEYNGKNAITPILFYKNRDAIGFGQANDSMGMAFGNFDFNDLKKSFGNQIQMDTLSSENFGFSNDLSPKMNKKSKIIIQENGKKPLVIEDGEVIEGGEGYSIEELDKIKKQHQFELNGNQKLDFNFGNSSDMNNLKEQMEKMQSQLLQMMPNSENDAKNLKDLKSNKDTTKEELKQAKEEMLKAKKEMEEARKELQKAKSEIKMRKT